ncbi:MAG: hypothetical protein ABFD97_01190 [Syntrophobacter sp.]
MDLNKQELNITELRRQKRPLWMSDLGMDNYADIIGGGGDIWTDRLPPAWPRHTGLELSEVEEQELGPVNLDEFRLPGMSASEEASGGLSEPSYTESYMESSVERKTSASAPESDEGLGTKEDGEGYGNK